MLQELGGVGDLEIGRLGDLERGRRGDLERGDGVTWREGDWEVRKVELGMRFPAHRGLRL